MKSIWLTICAVAALCSSVASSDEPAKPPASAPAADPIIGKEPGEVRDNNGLMMKLVWCPPGYFTMEYVEVITELDAMKEDKPDDDDEDVERKDEPAPKPRQTTKIRPVKVFVTKGYWLGKYEVTQSEWKRVMHTEPWKDLAGIKEGADFPATGVSWSDARDFCRELTGLEHAHGRLSKDWKYTLPTEAQWELACRARTTTRFDFGDDESKLGDYAWIHDNAANVGQPYAHQVGQKEPNRWGLYDMHGNVFEWCRDVYIENLPGGRDPEVIRDPRGELQSKRVFRGSSWFAHAAYCRSASRNGVLPIHRSNWLGFRPALSPVR